MRGSNQESPAEIDDNDFLAQIKSVTQIRTSLN